MLRTDAPPRRDLHILIRRWMQELEKWLDLYEESRHRLAELSTEINWYDRDAGDRLAEATARLDSVMEKIRQAIEDLDIDLVLTRSAGRVN